jgi:hypothetical protein
MRAPGFDTPAPGFEMKEPGRNEAENGHGRRDPADDAPPSSLETRRIAYDGRHTALDPSRIDSEVTDIGS